MTDYIREAVELADGWDNYKHKDTGEYLGPIYGAFPIGTFAINLVGNYPPILDALAAQLVRQVDAIGSGSGVWIFSSYCEVHNEYCLQTTRTHENTDDRTMNTIKAIVDSGVLNVR